MSLVPKDGRFLAALLGPLPDSDSSTLSLCDLLHPKQVASQAERDVYQQMLVSWNCVALLMTNLHREPLEKVRDIRSSENGDYQVRSKAEQTSIL